MERAIEAGPLGYQVQRAWGANETPGKITNEAPNDHWLVIAVGVINRDKLPHVIPPFRLLDDMGGERLPSPKIRSGTIDLSALKPNAVRWGWVIFDVPMTHKYRLRVGGKSVEGFVELDITELEKDEG